MLLSNHWINQRNKKKILRDKGKWKHNSPKLMGWSKSCYKREVYSSTILPQETRKISNKHANLTPKTTSERRTNKT